MNYKEEAKLIAEIHKLEVLFAVATNQSAETNTVMAGGVDSAEILVSSTTTAATITSVQISRRRFSLLPPEQSAQAAQAARAAAVRAKQEADRYLSRK